LWIFVASPEEVQMRNRNLRANRHRVITLFSDITIISFALKQKLYYQILEENQL